MPASLETALDELGRLRRYLVPEDRRVLLFVLGMKVLLFLFGVAVIHVVVNRPLSPNETVFSLWNRWDAPHYLSLARDGYVTVGQGRFLLVFFPLFPWLVRSLEGILGSYVGSAIAVSTVASLFLAVVFRRLASLDDAALGEPAVFFLFVFPTAYFLHIGYTESLFLSLTVAAFLSARYGHWLLAGTLGGLAALTRVNALILVPALALEAWAEYRRDRRWRWQWLCIALPLVGLAAYLLLNQVVGGSPLRFLDYQAQNWYRSFAWPSDGLAESLNAACARKPTEAHMIGAEELFFSLLGLAATIVAWVRLRPSYAVWMTGNWLLFTCQAFIMSVPRYTLTLFPLFILFAQFARWRAVAALVTFWSLLLFSFFASQFVQGRWAF